MDVVLVFDLKWHQDWYFDADAPGEIRQAIVMVLADGKLSLLNMASNRVAVTGLQPVQR